MVAIADLYSSTYICANFATIGAPKMYLWSQSTVHYQILPILTALFAIILTLCRGASVPLPDVCWEDRGDQSVPDSVSTSCEGYQKVRRFFFHSTKHCKKFGLCPSAATHLDQDTTRIYNYFQSLAECENACTNAVECPLEPLQEIDNGHPLVLPGDSEGRLGYGVSVTFACNEGYRLVQETTRTCQLNGTWDGVQPHCEVQCPKPESLAQNVSISPLQQYYNVRQSVQLDCMDGLYGNTTWTCREQGNWDGPAPTCSRDCAPQVIDNAHPPEIFHNGQTVTYSYRCYDGYSMLYNNSSLSCTNGQLQGNTPICTRVQIRKADGTALAHKNGTFHFVMVENAENEELTCGLDGLQQHRYTVNWTLPKKPNGEVPPGISVSGNSLHFNKALPEVRGTYNCAIAGINVSVIVEITSENSFLPSVYYLHPTNTIKSLRGETKTIMSLTSGSRPLYVTWQHNGSRVVDNSTMRNSQFTVMQVDTNAVIFSLLTIHSVDEITQGTYKVVADNSVGEVSSQEVQLMLAQQPVEEGSRGKREAPFCDRDPRKVVLAGVVRRTGRSEAGLRTVRLRVDRVLRGDARGIARRSVNIHVLPETDSSRLRRGQSVILSGVATGEAVFSFGAPIEDYSSSLEKAILEC